MIEMLTHSSPLLRGFPMGDPDRRTFPVYLPPGYDAKMASLPTVYFLAGFSGKGSTYLTDDSAFGTPLAERFDRAISAGSLRPFVGVFPDCTSKLGHSQYVNSPVLGSYMDYLCDDLTAFIDYKYRTDHTKRVLVGHSSGGFGALITGMLRPDAFRWIGSSAGDGFYEVSLLRNVNTALIEINKAGGVKEFIEMILAKPTARNIPGSAFEALLTLAMAPCYAPNPSNPPLYGDLFFDLETGAIRQDVWKRYMEWDPVRMVDKYAANLKKLAFIQLESGMQDEHALQWAHRQIAVKLKNNGIRFELNEYPGAHSGHHWRFEDRLRRIFATMGV